MASRRALLAALTIAWTVVWVQRAIVGPVGPLIQADLGVDYARLGLLPSLGLLGGAAGYLAGGRWASRSIRACLLTGTALLALSTFAAGLLAHDYAQLAVAMLVQGFAEGLFYVPALALVSRAYPAEGAGRALGILDSGISLGSVLAFAAAPLLADALSGWRGPFLVAGVLGIAVLPLLALAAPRRQPPQPSAALREVMGRRAAPIYAAIVLLIISYFAVLYLAPAFLLTRGFDLPTADGLTALAVVLGVPWHLLGGHFSDKHGPARVAAGFVAVQGVLTIALGLPLPALPTAVLLVASYSVSIAAFVALMALVQRVFGHELAAPAFGLFWSVGYLGGSIGPLLIGIIADRGGFGPAMALLGCFALATALVLLPTVRREKASSRRPV